MSTQSSRTETVGGPTWLDACAARAVAELDAVPDDLIGPAGRLLKQSLALPLPEPAVGADTPHLASVTASGSRGAGPSQPPLMLGVE